MIDISTFLAKLVPKLQQRMSSIIDDLRNEFNKTNNTVIKLIWLNIFVFVGVLVLRVMFFYSSYAAIFEMIISQLQLPAELPKFAYRPWTIVSNFFLHQGFFHIAFNLLFLYWFGQILEEYIGGRRVAALYILGGLSGGVMFLLVYNLVPYLNQNISQATLEGASGAIFAIIVAAATLLPDYTFFLILLGPVRLKYIAAFYIVLSIAELVGTNAGGNLAHLAGALVGFGFIRSLQRGIDWGTPIYSFLEFFKVLFTSKPAPKIPRRERTTATIRKYSANNETLSVGAPDQDEIDSILDKISKSGYESLSREEKQKLYKASQQ